MEGAEGTQTELKQQCFKHTPTLMTLLDLAERFESADDIDISIPSQLAPDLLKLAEGLKPPVVNGSDIAMGWMRLALN